MSYGEPSSSEQEDGAFTDEDSDHAPLRRSSRAVTAAKVDMKRQTSLPFSPKKTRSRKIISLVEDEDEEDARTSSRRHTPAATRRSARATKRTRENPDDDDFIDDEDDYENASRGKARSAKKKGPAKKAPRGYGIVNSQTDAFVEEPGVLAHRKHCEKCEREPAHKLLQKAKKLKPRKRKTEDDFEDDDNEHDRVAGLGGWVRW